MAKAVKSALITDISGEGFLPAAGEMLGGMGYDWKADWIDGVTFRVSLTGKDTGKDIPDEVAALFEAVD